MITSEMKEVYGEQTCLDLDKLDTRFLGCLSPTTVAALIVAMVSAPDTDDADGHIRNKLVEDGMKILMNHNGHKALKLLHGYNCGIETVAFSKHS